MAYSVDWIAKVISIPTSDLTLVSGTRYSLDMSNFLAEVRRLEWEPTEGLWAPAIVEHTNTRFDFAGVNYAPFDDLQNGYTVQFTGVATRVDLLGSNNDIIDVLIPTGVSVVPSNSAGLQIVQTGSGITEQDKDDIVQKNWDRVLTGATHNIPSSAGRRLRQLGDVVPGDITDVSATVLTFDTNVNSSYDGFYNDQYIRFISGNLAGIVRVIESITVTGQLTVSEALPVAPANTDEFEIIPVHIHPKEQVAESVWADLTAQDIETMITELHKLQGLLAGKPMTVTPTSRTVDDISQTISGDGENTSTVERDP